jgi:dihydrolipoamide dehydrogenase
LQSSEKLAEARNGLAEHGIKIEGASLDLAAMMARKDKVVGTLTRGVEFLFRKNKVEWLKGTGRIAAPGRVAVAGLDGEESEIEATSIIIATGSEGMPLTGVEIDEKRIVSSTGALSLDRVPGRLAVIGGGYIGLELGTAFAKIGSRVTVVEALPRILPHYDAELTRPVGKRLAELGVEVLTGAKATGLDAKSAALLVEMADGKPKSIPAQKVLVTVGRKPLTEGWGIEELVLDMAGKFIGIDDQCRTSMRGVYAIGDVTGEPMLAHRAMAQGEMVAEIVAGHKRSWDKRSIPAVCFTDPEVVSAGLSPEEARAQGREVKTALFPFSANGRAMTMLAEEGFIRVTARADNHLVLGIQAVGQGVSELSAAFSLAIEMGARLEDIADTIHAHPTQSEAFPEAAMRVLGRALHI